MCLSLIKLLRAKNIVLISTFTIVRASSRYSAGGKPMMEVIKQITI
jgi:hypothetical protein